MPGRSRRPTTSSARFGSSIRFTSSSGETSQTTTSTRTSSQSSRVGICAMPSARSPPYRSRSRAGFRPILDRSSGELARLSRDERDALNAVGVACVEGEVRDRLVVIAPDLTDRETSLRDRLGIVLAWDRARDARGPELRVTSRLLLQWLGAHDVGEGQATAWTQDPSRLGEHPSLDGRQIDDAIRDHGVEALIFERQVVDRARDELHVRDPSLVSQAGRLLDLLRREVHPDDGALGADLLGSKKDVRARSASKVQDALAGLQ